MERRGACVENMGSERSSIWLGKCAEWYGRLYDSGSRFWGISIKDSEKNIESDRKDLSKRELSTVYIRNGSFIIRIEVVFRKSNVFVLYINGFSVWYQIEFEIS